MAKKDLTLNSKILFFLGKDSKTYKGEQDKEVLENIGYEVLQG